MVKERADGTSGGRGGRRWLRVVGWTLLAGVVLLVLGAVGVWWLWESQPAAYERRRAFVLQRSEAELEALAEGAERRLAGVVSGRLPPGVPVFEPVPEGVGAVGGAEGSMALRVTFDELNAFLATRLDDYLAHEGERMPAAVKSITVWNDDGRPAVSVDYDGPELAAVVTATLEVTPLPEGAAGGRVKLEGVRVGRLPLPWSWVVSTVEGAAGDAVNPAVTAALTSLREGAVFPGVVRLENGRAVRLEGWRVEDDAVELDVRAATAEEARGAVGF